MSAWLAGIQVGQAVSNQCIVKVTLLFTPLEAAEGVLRRVSDDSTKAMLLKLKGAGDRIRTGDEQLGNLIGVCK
jgi:hypothetical protein